MFEIKFRSGEAAQFDAPVTVYDAAVAALGQVSREIIAARIGDEVFDLTHPVDSDAEVTLLTFKGALLADGAVDEKDDGGRRTFWHTASHILAQAVKRLFPDVKLTIGPSVDNGFYYDFDSDTAFSQDILAQIEKEMKKIVKENHKLERFTLPRAEAKALMEEKGEPYKVLLIDRVPEGEEISFYKQGDFVDLCAGPHLFATGAVKAFKLTQCTGAYWEGNSQNKMLQRVYGTAYPTKDELNAYLEAVEEAKKRDHNKIGRELDYFTTVDTVGQGLPIMLPKGARTIQLLQRFVEDEEERRGYILTKTPLMAKREFYKISGHWDHYLDGMFVLGDPYDETKECFALRPMTCPFQYQVYLNKKRSYRDLPMRLGETSTLFRNEDSGEMHGLIRVRQFTISEGHLVLRPDQLEEEFRGCLDLAMFMLDALGLKEDCSFRFSQWDPNNTAKYEGTPEQWDEAQTVMGNLLDKIGLDYTIGIDEAAFYGPKLDIQIKNVHGKEDTLITIQIDMLLAKKFGMEYTDSDNTQKTPYIIHRTSLGCYERTLALILEKYAGALPVWIAPVQATVLPVSGFFDDYGKKVLAKLKEAGIRAEIDLRNEKIGYRIREAQLSKVPYMLVVGADEQEAGTVAVRARKEGEGGVMSVDDFIAKVKDEVKTFKK
ncbi:MAG: threonine--tRNA ligase [Ruminococcaceae bacterium]|nr:threonine--tRNA ligase [Oscillospiraceae bacterium]